MSGAITQHRPVTAPLPAKTERGSAQDDAQIIRLFLRQARKGDLFALNYVADLYYYGRRGVKQNFLKAALWFRHAANKGDAKAQRVLGHMYLQGEGVDKNEKTAAIWYSKAAEQNDDVAQHNLAVCYQNGSGVHKDEKKAVLWYRKAAEQGNAWAQCNLALSYKLGFGVKVDVVEAAGWYRKAAEQGNALAQHSLAVCYQYGEGVKADIDEAKRWYRLASDQGDIDAANVLLLIELLDTSNAENMELDKGIEELTEKAQDAEGDNSEIPLRRFMNSDIILKETQELLVKSEVAEQDRADMGACIARLIEDYHRDPAAAKATIAAMKATQVRAEIDSQSWQERVTEQAPVERKGRWKDFVPPTPDEIREARRLVGWQARHKDEPLDPEVLRKAHRTVRWADREHKRQKQRSDAAAQDEVSVTHTTM